MAVETRRRKRMSALEEEELLEFLEKKKQRQEEEDERVPKRKPEKGLLREMERIFGQFTEPIWLGEKKLTKTDVVLHNHRLFFPVSIIERLKPHLKAWEKGEMEPTDGPGIRVSIIDPWCGQWELRLKRRTNPQQFVLIQGWHSVMKVNRLKEEELLDVWAYRHGSDHKLGFILQRINP